MGQTGFEIRRDLVRRHIVAHRNQCTQKRGDRDLTVFIDTDIIEIVGIRFIFQPSAAVRNDRRSEKLFTGFIVAVAVINARRTNQLRNNRTFRTVDDKRSAFGHQRKIAHKDFLLLDFAGFLVQQSRRHAKRRCIGNVALFAFFYRIFGVRSNA